MLDRYYTPEHIAVNLLNSLKVTDVESIADFAVGDGSLIKELPFNARNIIGLDIDVDVISKLQESNPKWLLKSGDFLNPDETTTAWLTSIKNSLDIIVLNPPFSCKGKKRISIQVSENKIISFRPYLAFLYKALQFLKNSGVLIAILPLSCIKSDIDNVALNYLREDFEISFGEKLGRNVFRGCSPSSIILSIKAKPRKTKKKLEKITTRIYRFKAQILRGSTQMHTTFESGEFPVLHTNNLQEFKIANKTKYVNIKVKYAQGSYVCIPRVCLPKMGKVVLVENRNYVLSDCLFAIKGETLEQTEIIKNLILENWNTFETMYQSTCAPYITIIQLNTFFESFDIETISVMHFENMCDLIPLIERREKYQLSTAIAL